MSQPTGVGKVKEHELKTHSLFFWSVFEGVKTFEIRKDDRGFAIGDHLKLREWHPLTDAYTGAAITVRVTYITSYAQVPGNVVMGIVVLQKTKGGE